MQLGSHSQEQIHMMGDMAPPQHLLNDLISENQDSSSPPRGFITPDSVRFYEVASTAKKACELSFFTSSILLTVCVIVNVLFRSYNTFFPVIVAINVGISLLGLVLSLTTLAFLRRNFPPSSTEASQRKIKQTLCCVLCILLIQGAIGIAKEALTLFYIIEIQSRDDAIQYKNDERIFIQDLVISFFAFLPFMVLLIIMTLGVVLFLLMIILHVLILVLSCSQVNILATFKKAVKHLKKKIFQGGIEKLVPFKGQFGQSLVTTISQQDTQMLGESCQICLELFTNGEQVYRLPCTQSGPLHYFHAHCLQIWATKASECPTCRKSFNDLVK